MSALLALGLAALPPLVLFVMNTASWGTTALETIALAYEIAIYGGLLLAGISLWLAVRELRRGPPYTPPAIALAIAIGFIVWVGPDAYMDIAEMLGW